MNLRTLIFLPCLIGALAVAPLPCVANTPMTRYLDLQRTDYAVAGVGGIGAPPAIPRTTCTSPTTKVFRATPRAHILHLRWTTPAAVSKPCCTHRMVKASLPMALCSGIPCRVAPTRTSPTH